MRISFVVAVFLFSCSLPACAAVPTHALLRAELLSMSELDQEVRSRALKGDFKKWVETDASNRHRLKEIVEQHGWPSYDMVGEDGATAAWLLAQHADSDKIFQDKVLQLMEPLVTSGQASGKDYAYLYDRTHYPQRYGTQGNCVSREEWRPFDIEDVAGLEVRRKKLGMPSMSEYAAMFKEICASNYSAVQSPSETRRTIPIPTS